MNVGSFGHLTETPVMKPGQNTEMSLKCFESGLYKMSRFGVCPSVCGFNDTLENFN